MSNVQNSYLEEDCTQLKVLIVVPHQDDEINLAGATIKHFTESGAQVFCVYTTNGDYCYSAETRIQEACASLQCLGVDKQNIFCLGYGDTPNWKELKHISNSLTQPVVSSAGHKETYGTRIIDDYVFKKTGCHHSYCRMNYKADLKQVVLDIKADVIIGIDLDSHQDHRFCSLLLDEILGEILCKYPDYRPILFKGFAYGTAFDAEKDFYNINLLSTIKPKKGQSINLNYDIHVLSIYDWQDRVRFLVPNSCRKQFLLNNIIFKALCCHKSQLAGWSATSIINGDQVFWQKRTDNLLFNASLTASSGNGELVRDFKLWDSNDLEPAILPLTRYVWQPSEQDYVKSIKFTWEKPQMIKLIQLYGSINDGNQVLAGKILVNHKIKAVFRPVPANGAPLRMEITNENCVTSLAVQLTDWKGTPGLAQIEAFGELIQTSVLKPWIKIMVDDNFIYDYWIAKNQKYVEVSVYRFNYAGPVKFSIIEGNDCQVEENKLCFSDDCAMTVLRVEAEDDKRIFDQVVIRRCDKRVFDGFKILQRIDEFLTHIYLRFWRKYVVLKKRCG